jgi:exodeoxyribonuclease V alpha subunit
VRDANVRITDEISPAYAITIQKSQGSEFPAVVIPLATQHCMLLQRNLIYTGIMRGMRLQVMIGQKKAFAIAVRNGRPQERYSGLLATPVKALSLPLLSLPFL